MPAIFLMFSKAKMLNTYAIQIFPGIANSFCLFMLKQYIESLPDSLLEAARIDGAGHLYVCLLYTSDFLLEVKNAGIRIGLVTSGLYEKAYPEILSAFQTLNMGKPEEFYDCIISAGYALGPGGVGTLGELSPKPHPWLYAETGRVGLQIPFEERGRVIGVEDSAAGLHAIRLAGYVPVALAGGNLSLIHI